MKKIKVDCNLGCGKRFSPALKEEPHGDGVRQFFVCPHCNQIYLVAKITARGLEIRKQIQAAKDRKEVERLQGEMRKEVVRL